MMKLLRNYILYIIELEDGSYSINDFKLKKPSMLVERRVNQLNNAKLNFLFTIEVFMRIHLYFTEHIFKIFFELKFTINL
jgi:hypothetical protein